MSDEFAGKLALVTGAGQGIGRAVAIGLAKQGAHVVATDLVEDGVGSLVTSLTAMGLACEARKLDVGDAEAVEMLVDELELERPIELLANVAGVLELGSTTALDDDVWRRTFRVNTDGVFHVSRSVARRMKSRARGAIVIVGSNAARVPRVQMAAYAASKAAAHMFAKCLALELAEHGVRCSLVAPGSADQRALWTDAQGAERSIVGNLSGYRLGSPLRRIGGPEDVADAVLFLLSERARQITLHAPAAEDPAPVGVRIP
jgi:2,3-dihydro-2,3-dihydroxybenzoate dehydrogenase